MSKPVSLLGMAHVCPIVDPGPKPHIGGPVVTAGQATVFVNGIPVAVEGGQCLCTGVPCTDPMTKGSAIVRINGRGVMRIGDGTAHGGRLVAGFPGITAG